MFAPKYLIKEDVCWSELSNNKSGCHLLQYRFDKIDWSYLSLNESDEALFLLRNNQNKIIWNCLNSNENPEAIKLLIENPKKINWYYLTLNECKLAIDVLRENYKRINWTFLSENPSAIELIRKNINKIYLPRLFMNSNAGDLIKDILKYNPNKICWDILGSNTCPEIIDILDDYITATKTNEYMEKFEDWYNLSRNPMSSKILNKNIDKIDWETLCSNKNDDCLKILEQNEDKITRWDILSENPSPRAIKIIKNNLDKFNLNRINWDYLCNNPSAIELLEKNPDKINWANLSSNTNAIHLFAPLDKEYMREQINEFKQELAAYVFNPNRLMKYCDKYGIDYTEIDEIY